MLHRAIVWKCANHQWVLYKTCSHKTNMARCIMALKCLQGQKHDPCNPHGRCVTRLISRDVAFWNVSPKNWNVRQARAALCTLWPAGAIAWNNKRKLTFFCLSSLPLKYLSADQFDKAPADHVDMHQHISETYSPIFSSPLLYFFSPSLCTMDRAVRIPPQRQC